MLCQVDMTAGPSPSALLEARKPPRLPQEDPTCLHVGPNPSTAASPHPTPAAGGCWPGALLQGCAPPLPAAACSPVPVPMVSSSRPALHSPSSHLPGCALSMFPWELNSQGSETILLLAGQYGEIANQKVKNKIWRETEDK